FREVDCVKVPWVMMASGGREKDPTNLLCELTYRWDHDLRHPKAVWGKAQCKYEQIEVKCIFRPQNVSFIATHHPIVFDEADFDVVDSIQNEPAAHDLYHPNLRNVDIENGYLLCYHYRVVSTESAARKIESHTKLRGEGGYAAYSPEVIMAHDYAEIVDETLKLKTEKRLS
ncbi:MAG: hypothetical protein AAGD96_34950, partial [Chloroflexota bacterium]